MLPAIFDVLGEDAKCVGTIVEKLVYHSNLEILQMDVVDGIAGITFQFVDGICAVYLTVFHVDVLAVLTIIAYLTMIKLNILLVQEKKHLSITDIGRINYEKI